MEKVFIDTSGFVGLFTENDQNHRKAISIFEELKSTKASLYTSDYCIDETITTILVRSSRKQSVYAGDVLFSSELFKIVNVSPNYLESAWKLYKKYHDKNFSFTDVTCFSIMQDLSIQKVFSFDKEFTQAGFLLLE